MTKIRLTFELSQEPELPLQWLSRCVELDVMSAATSPDLAVEALAEAVRMTVRHEARRLGSSAADAFSAIADRVAANRDRPGDADP